MPWIWILRIGASENFIHRHIRRGQLLQAGNNILATANDSIAINGALTFSAGKNLVVASNGGFTQRGTLTVTSPDIVVDTTGPAGGASQLLNDLLTAQRGGTSITNAGVVKSAQFAPNGSTGNAISFDTGTVNATGSVMLLLGDAGAMTGTVNVLGLGVSGQGGSADLHGSIVGDTTQAAAQQGFINPQTQTNYLFNGCPIGATTCGGPTPVPPPVPVPILPLLSDSVDILLARPAERDIEAQLNNIFEADLLCEQLLQINPEGARDICRWQLQFAPAPVAVAPSLPR